MRDALDAEGADVRRMKAPIEREVRQALEGDELARVAMVSRDDASVLRVALMVRYVDDEVPMLVTIFDPTMAGEVRKQIAHCEVTSMADIVAPSLAGPCLGDDLVAVRDDCDPPLGVREAGRRDRGGAARAAAAASRVRAREGAASSPTTRARRCCCGARSRSSRSC